MAQRGWSDEAKDLLLYSGFEQPVTASAGRTPQSTAVEWQLDRPTDPTS